MERSLQPRASEASPANTLRRFLILCTGATRGHFTPHFHWLFTPELRDLDTGTYRNNGAHTAGECGTAEILNHPVSEYSRRTQVSAAVVSPTGSPII